MEPTTPAFDISVLTTGITDIIGDVLTAFGTILPVALGVFAAVWGVRKLKQFFKTASN